MTLPTNSADTGASEQPKRVSKATHKQADDLRELIDNIELPWPEDVFGIVPEGEWHEIDEFAKTRGYRVDTISASLMRRGWRVFKRQLLEELTDMVAPDQEATSE